ncbi:hypothetical protein AALP_AA6G304500 [Arabis alpina]|uniref:Uncharacterized protein n=1 Tax=Arabis alpina TaxID=50452 RepID=A0A087GSQ6_ARAAL|nr:hypothetical protein AALP_AA6G304500 [Arabis alpina]
MESDLQYPSDLLSLYISQKMYPSSKQATRFEWELTKENVRPLKRGHNVRLLNHALQFHFDHQ